MSARAERDRPAGRPRASQGPASAEERVAIGLLLGLHAALVTALCLAAWTLWKYWATLQLEPWQKVSFEVGIGAAVITFGWRGARLARRFFTRPS